jgi:hypothetical protein
VKALSDTERQLLEKLAEAGKPTELNGEDLLLGRLLQQKGLVLVVRDSAFAVITPKGRHALTDADNFKLKKDPFG